AYGVVASFETGRLGAQVGLPFGHVIAGGVVSRLGWIESGLLRGPLAALVPIARLLLIRLAGLGVRVQLEAHAWIGGARRRFCRIGLGLSVRRLNGFVLAGRIIPGVIVAACVVVRLAVPPVGLVAPGQEGHIPAETDAAPKAPAPAAPAPVSGSVPATMAPAMSVAMPVAVSGGAMGAAEAMTGRTPVTATAPLTAPPPATLPPPPPPASATVPTSAPAASRPTCRSGDTRSSQQEGGDDQNWQSGHESRGAHGILPAVPGTRMWGSGRTARRHSQACGTPHSTMAAGH